MQPDSDAPVGTARSCPHCAADVAPPGRFCTDCGRPLAAPEECGVADDERGSAGEDRGTAGEDRGSAGQDRGSAGGAAAPPAEEPADTRQPTDPHAPLPPASGRGASLRCNSCGTVNPRTRALCRACGLDLDPEDRTAVPARPPLVRPRRPRRARARRRWSVTVAAVLAIPVLVGAVLSAAELGPFAPTDDAPLPPVTFPEDRYPRSGAPLALSDVATLTAASADGQRTFSPEALVDGDPTTAWHSDPADLPAGAAETIDVFLQRPAWITAIALSNGDHHDLDAYRRAGRIARAELRFDGGVRVRAQLEDPGRQRQLLTLEEPVLSTALRLELTEVIDGTELPGVAISSIEVRGHPAEDRDVQLAEERAERRPATGAVVVPAPTDLPALRLPRPAQGS